jgi:hypothetical protein
MMVEQFGDVTTHLLGSLQHCALGEQPEKLNRVEQI